MKGSLLTTDGAGAAVVPSGKTVKNVISESGG